MKNSVMLVTRLLQLCFLKLLSFEQNVWILFVRRFYFDCRTWMLFNLVKNFLSTSGCGCKEPLRFAGQDAKQEWDSYLYVWCCSKPLMLELLSQGFFAKKKILLSAGGLSGRNVEF